MAVLPQKVEASLKNFFIFNPILGPDEGGEEQKILYYYPAHDDLNRKINNVGVTVAIIKFVATFTNDESCKNIHTRKTVQYFFQPEPNFWMVMTINVPYDVKIKDGTEYLEYHGEDVHDTTYHTFLEHAYKIYRLQNGKFTHVLKDLTDRGNQVELKVALKKHYDRYIKQLRPTFSNILHLIRTVQYYPLHQNHFLKIANFLELIKTGYECIDYGIFMYHEQVVWSDVDPQEMFCVYDYLTSDLFPRILSYSPQTGSETSCRTRDHGALVTDTDKPLYSPKLYLYGKSETPQTYDLIVYQTLGIVVVFFINNDYVLTEAVLSELTAQVTPMMSAIAHDLALNKVLQLQSKSGEAEANGPKYIFFNNLSYKHSGNMSPTNMHVSDIQLPSEVLNLVTDVLKDVETEKGNTKETILKTHTDYWVVKRSSNWRHYVGVIHKSSTLHEITEGTKAMCDEIASNVFFDKK